MSRNVVLVTGAGGEMGHLLLPALQESGHDVVALDLVPLPPSLTACCRESLAADILEKDTLRELVRRHSPDRVFHLAAVLSTRAEQQPHLAHRVNVDGTVSLMALCLEEAERTGRPVRFLFPSSIAAYGLPGAREKNSVGAVKEDQWNAPSGVYGCNKLYCEMLGTYFTKRAAAEDLPGLDFRSIRFPGLISAETVPSGGTSDYAPEMVHAAASGEPYACFVGPDTRLPFMTMTDAVDAFMKLSSVPRDDLSTCVYNIRAFSPSAGEIRERVLDIFPDARITFEPDASRQSIVDTWPADVDDRLARRDWGFSPAHGFDEALKVYLLPSLRRRYRSTQEAPDSVRR